MKSWLGHGRTDAVEGAAVLVRALATVELAAVEGVGGGDAVLLEVFAGEGVGHLHDVVLGLAALGLSLGEGVGYGGLELGRHPVEEKSVVGFGKMYQRFEHT